MVVYGVVVRFLEENRTQEGGFITWWCERSLDCLESLFYLTLPFFPTYLGRRQLIFVLRLYVPRMLFYRSSFIYILHYTVNLDSNCQLLQKFSSSVLD